MLHRKTALSQLVSIAMVKTLLLIISGLALSSCSTIAPLDPKVADTGQVQSSNARATDVLEYEIDIEVFPKTQSIKGNVTTTFKIVESTEQLELNLDSRFNITDIQINGETRPYSSSQGIITIDLQKPASTGDIIKSTVFYDGKPHVAIRAPWNGGFVWSKTSSDDDFIATAVQGEGCDMFWPCKDHFNDKADVTIIKLTVPDPLIAVTNGVLESSESLPNNRTRFNWRLGVPASNYNIALNIAPYERIQTSYTSVNGAEVPIEFWALPENADKARALIKNDLRAQIAFYEDRLGPYPWGQEKLGFVETPHLGMEHQTINAYGKGYVRDENGFDWLLHHELAHEWFGNLMTHEELNDAWLHEGFGLYMQPDYALYKFGEASYHYRMYRSYLGLLNCHPVVREGQITSNEAFNPDIYGKGGWTLHTLRWIVGEKMFWSATRELLYGTDKTEDLQYPIQPRYRNTEEFISIINRLTNSDYNWLFDVYLKQAALPELIETREANKLTLEWKAPKDLPFPMPVPVVIDGKSELIPMTNNKGELPLLASQRYQIDPEMKILRYLPIIGKCEENQKKRDNR